MSRAPAQTPTGAAVAPIAQDPAPQASAWRRASLGVAEIRTLESFAVALGVQLGAPDDGAVFTAANNAIIAARKAGGLAVSLPMGAVEHTSVGLLLDNNGGYFCPAPGRCTVRQVRSGSSAAATWLVSVNDPYATNLVLSGITFDGAWRYGRAPYAGAPEQDPWLDRQGGVNITHAFQGVSDASYFANSTIGGPLPLDHIENLVIVNFGGDCLTVTGAGQNNYQNIRGGNCGGHGLTINSYDNKFTDIDFGGAGRSCLRIDSQGAASQIQGKVWYCGSRLKAGDDQGVYLNSGGDILDIIIQDTYGDGLYNMGQANNINATVSWQGVLAAMDPGPISAYTCVGCTYNIVQLNAAIFPRGQQYPNITRLYRDLTNGRNYGRNNIVTISEAGWPQDYGESVWVPFWFEGPLDVSNRITLNGVDRIRYSQPDPAGVLGLSTGMNGSGVGIIVFGPNSSSPGKVAVLCQGVGASICSLQGFHNTAAFATGTLTSSRNFEDLETVTIGDAVYTFESALRNVPNHVHIGADEAATLNNLTYAINAAGGAPGVDYSRVTVPNAAVTATNDGAHGLTVTAKIAGRAANGIATTTSAHAKWSHPTLLGGSAGTQTYASAVTWDQDGHAGLPNLPGPYPNDAAAAAAGVRVGDLYRDASSVVHVRVAPGN